MKKYLKEFTYKEVIDKLQNGEVIYHDRDEDTEVPYKLFMYNGVLCWEDESKDIHVGISLGITELNKQCYFNEPDETFEITESGVYKTRDGKKVFVTSIDKAEYFSINGVIENTDEFETWTPDGRFSQMCLTKKDIIGKWEEQNE